VQLRYDTRRPSKLCVHSAISLSTLQYMVASGVRRSASGRAYHRRFGTCITFATPPATCPDYSAHLRDFILNKYISHSLSKASNNKSIQRHTRPIEHHHQTVITVDEPNLESSYQLDRSRNGRQWRWSIPAQPYQEPQRLQDLQTASHSL